MKEERLLRAMTQIDDALIQSHDPALAEKPATSRKRRPLRIALIAAAVAALLVTAAMAISPSFRDMILTSLGFRAPYATEALGSCEDQGITIEAQKALADGRASFLYFTVHDPTGVFFLEDTQNRLEVDFLIDGEEIPGNWGQDCTGEPLERLSYDPETQTALYLFRAGIVPLSTVVESPVPTHARISMEQYLPGQRSGDVNYHGPSSISEGEDRLTAPTEVLESTQENGATVLLPEQNPQPIGESCPEVYISSMGFASDGYYHVRWHQDPNVTQAQSCDGSFCAPFLVAYLMRDENGNPQQRDWDETVITPVSDGWDYCLTALTQESFDHMLLIAFSARYSVSGGWVMGDWSLTVPVSPVEHRTAKPEQTLILSATKDSPPPSGRDYEAQVAAVSVSTLSVTADFVCPEGYHRRASIEGEETACAVTFADGTVLSPTYLAQHWSGHGWVMWEFAEPVDPSQVVSVTLNGNEIAFPAE